MTIIFEEPKPNELWSLKEPTAIAVNGTVEMTLTVCADAPPLPAIETQVALYLELDHAEHLKSQATVAIDRARIQLKQARP